MVARTPSSRFHACDASEHLPGFLGSADSARNDGPHACAGKHHLLSGNRSDASSWWSSSCVERWRRGLLHITGCSSHEIVERVDILLEFRAGRGVSPERMIDESRRSPDRIERRTFYLSAARNTQADLVVQSFLIHNGINIFGELICMPNTVEGVMKEQGSQWASRRSKNPP
jgi:hypothetical protein